MRVGGWSRGWGGLEGRGGVGLGGGGGWRRERTRRGRAGTQVIEFEIKSDTKSMQLNIWRSLKRTGGIDVKLYVFVRVAKE